MASPAAEPAYKDRSTWLVVFGISQVLLGLVLLGFIGLIMLAAVMAPRVQPTASRADFLQSAMFYLAAAIIAFVLGGGSIWPRRWARALSVAYCWFWLFIGTVGILFASIFLPRMMRHMPAQPGSEGAQMFVVVLVVLFMSVVFVLIPGVLLLFYSCSNVKATFEARDPSPRWTDRCPMPVLVFGGLQGMGAASLLMAAVGTLAAFPLFGFVVYGPAARLAFLLLAPLWGAVAWGLLTMRKAGWWGALGLMLFLSLSHLITFTRVDVLEFYRRGGMPEEQLRMMSDSGFLQPLVQWMLPGFLALYLAYIVFLRRYFYRTPAVSPETTFPS